MNVYDNEDSVQQWLDKAYWPWPLALAYSIASNRPAALKQCVSVLDGSAGVPSEYVGLFALRLAYAHAIGDANASKIDWSKMHDIERPLVAAIESDKIAWRGRPAPGQPLGKPCDSSQWMGADIHAEATADLVQEGYRQFAGDLEDVLGERSRTVWLYDIHLKAADVIKLVDVAPPNIERDADDNWTKRALTSQQITAMEFIDVCGERWRNGEAGNAQELLGKYEIWVGKESGRGEPLGKTTFTKWRDRYRQGYRVNGRKLVFPS